MLVRILIGVGSALVAAWLALAVLVYVVRPRGEESVRLRRFIPQVIRLLASLYRDPGLPRSARWRVRLALVYNIQPFNLIPDFIPVVGLVDNAVVTVWALRSVVRMAGTDLVRAHWTGPPQDLAVLYRLAGIGEAGV
ncbi:MAG TPA: DUF1232 domain-containing protein [Acidimicrobiales bacterium]|nr:DUF1232 domain-containing protein [Acidimicrobiales bacterium]